MNITVTEPNRRTIPRADFGRVTVFFGEKNGKYPDANQVIVRGTDTQAAFDTPIVANCIGAEFDASVSPKPLRERILGLQINSGATTLFRVALLLHTNVSELQRRRQHQPI